MWMTQDSQKQKQSFCVCVWLQRHKTNTSLTDTHQQKKTKKIQRVKQTLSLLHRQIHSLSLHFHWFIIRANNTVPYVITAIIMSPGLHYRLRLWTWSSPRGEFAQVSRSVEGRASEMKSWSSTDGLTLEWRDRVLEERRVTLDWY